MGLPVDFGSKPRLSRKKRKMEEPKQCKMEEPKQCKMEESKQCKKIPLEAIQNEMIVEVSVDGEWVACQVIDMDPPVEMEAVRRTTFLLLPLSREIEEETLELSSHQLRFLSFEKEQQLSLQFPKRRHSIITAIYSDTWKPHLSSAVKKYYSQRYHLFARWDQGIRFDEVGLFSVTPESLALFTAIRCACGVVIDAFAGIGGNAIQLARTCGHVIAIDLEMSRLKLLKHNAGVYDVANRIDCICGDSTQLLPQLHADVVLLAPPWGGVEYGKKEVFGLGDFPPGLDGRTVFRLARRVTRNIVFVLPRTIDRKEVAQLADEGEMVEFVEGCVDGKLKMVIVFFGDLVRKGNGEVKCLV